MNEYCVKLNGTSKTVLSLKSTFFAT